MNSPLILQTIIHVTPPTRRPGVGILTMECGHTCSTAQYRDRKGERIPCLTCSSPPTALSAARDPEAPPPSCVTHATSLHVERTPI